MQSRITAPMKVLPSALTQLPLGAAFNVFIPSFIALFSTLQPANLFISKQIPSLSIMAVTKIPTFYRTFFLYIDPLICTMGIYIFFFDHQLYLDSGAPRSITENVKITPLIDFLLLCLGSYSIFILAMQLLILHQFKNAPDGLNLKLWRIVQFGIVLVDLGLLFAMFMADPGFWNVLGWRSGEWSNYGILGVVTSIRASFLLGVGF